MVSFREEGVRDIVLMVGVVLSVLPFGCRESLGCWAGDLVLEGSLRRRIMVLSRDWNVRVRRSGRGDGVSGKGR